MDAGVAVSAKGTGERISHPHPVAFSVYFCRNLGTVGAVALDCKGNVAYATSTGGMVNKMTGRVGDSPCIGRMGRISGSPQSPGPFLPISSFASLCGSFWVPWSTVGLEECSGQCLPGEAVGMQ